MLDYSFNMALDLAKRTCNAIPTSRSFFPQEITSKVKEGAADTSYNKYGMNSYTHQLTSRAASLRAERT